MEKSKNLSIVEHFKKVNIIKEEEKKKNKYIIAIDFDGTIVENQYPKIGKLISGAKKYINKLYEDGHTIIIWTCRYDDDKEDAKKFLEKNDINFHDINKNAKRVQKTFNPHPKIYADIYIDDRAITRLPEWKEIYELVNEWNPDTVL
jgi:hydroxymethylpyrimidine pyrophosphatase-like HAD family hydrolase